MVSVTPIVASGAASQPPHSWRRANCLRPAAPSRVLAAMWQQRLEHAVQLPDVAALDQTFLDMVRSTRPTIVTDVGSRDGEMGIACKRALPSAQVFAFEANPENFFQFAERACREGVIFVPLAIGPRRETIDIHVPDWASARQNAPLQFRGIGSARSRHDTAHHLTYTAAAVPLGEFFPLPEHADAVFAHWIDVEGFTYEVLDGLGAQLAARTAFLKIEVETQAVWQGQKLVGDCIAKCEELGFSPCAWFDHAEQFDILFVNPAHYPPGE